MAINSLSIRPLTDVSELRDFHCGIQAMDDFIHSGLEESMKNHYCNTYSVHYGTELVAMFALSFDSLELDSDSIEEMSEGLTVNKPEMSKGYVETFLSKHHYPALEIAYLAVEEKYRRQGMGKSIVNAIADMAQKQNMAGCMFLTVEAYIEKEYSAVPFYYSCRFEPCEFKKPNKETLRMFRAIFPRVEKA